MHVATETSGSKVAKPNSERVAENTLTARKDDVRTIVSSMLSRCGMKLSHAPYDTELHASVCEWGASRGYPIDDLRPWIPIGVYMGSLAYWHLPDAHSRVLIALYTTLLNWVDDAFEKDACNLNEFNRQWVMNEGAHKKEKLGLLDCVADHLREMARWWKDPVASNLIVTSSLDYITSMLVDRETDGMELLPEAANYSRMTRSLSGISVAFAVFVFPTDTPVRGYIQAMPEMNVFLGYSNDVLSFYKEECKGETANYVSILARTLNVTKYVALQRVADEVVEAHTAIVKILALCEEAAEAWNAFEGGYINLHVSSKRYRLDELELDY